MLQNQYRSLVLQNTFSNRSTKSLFSDLQCFAQMSRHVYDGVEDDEYLPKISKKILPYDGFWKAELKVS